MRNPLDQTWGNDGIPGLPGARGHAILMGLTTLPVAGCELTVEGLLAGTQATKKVVLPEVP